MNFEYSLSLLILCFVFLSPLNVFSQSLYSAPLNKTNPNEKNLYVDDDGYCVVALRYPSGANSIMYFKDGRKILESEGMLNYFKVEGYSSNQDVFNIYGKRCNASKVVTLDKKTLHVEIKDVDFPNLISHEDDYLQFSFNNDFYKLLLNKKRNTLKIYKLTSSKAEIIGNHYFEKDLFKILEKHSFQFVDQFENVNLTLLYGNKLYWRNDSLIFSYKTGNLVKGVGRKYLLINPKGNSAAERVIVDEQMKSSSTNEFLSDDKIFIIRSYYDSLVVDVKDYRSNNLITNFRFDVDKGLNIKRSPFVSTDGDTVETRWKEKNVDKKIIRDFHEASSFISIEKVPSSFRLTCGIQLFTGSGGGYAPGVGGAPGIYYPGSTSEGDQEYFKTCLSEQWEPIACDNYLSSQDKAIMRKNQLMKEDFFRFKEFLIGFDRQNVYLMYVDKELKNLFIEKF